MEKSKLSEKIIEKAKEAFRGLDVVVGYTEGSHPLKVSPCLIDREEDLESMVFNKLCINNLATYAWRLAKKTKGKIGMVLKPCDAKAIVQLVSEGLILRDKFKLIVPGCSGIIDYNKVMARLGGKKVASAELTGDEIIVETAGGKLTLKIRDFYADKCYWCNIADNPPAYDEYIENPASLDVEKRDKYADIKDLEKMSLSDIYSYWQEEFSRCIRCYACRNVCPMEVCQDACIVHLDFPDWQSQKAEPEENKFFQLIRVMHLAGRCTECGECERVCPQNIGIFKLMKKMSAEIERLFGFTPGMDSQAKPPLLTYKTEEENIEGEELI